ncbi:MAG: DUF4827 domain-containing protein [Muribaculaceae bacterium]|nr:DUF4827 domain-containing protein [Muribaculaceae bacterium]
MNRLFLSIVATVATLLTLGSCSDSKSYAELLSDENKSVNAFLAQHRVVDRIPADTVFEMGPNAPYYRLDEDGNVYMQVIQNDTPDDKAEEGDRVYFRFTRYSLMTYVVGGSNIGSGNANNLSTPATYFIFDDYYNTQSYQYGEGIQLPLKYLGYGCKVNLVIKSQAGPESDMTYVTPYLYDIQYFKPAL